MGGRSDILDRMEDKENKELLAEALKRAAEGQPLSGEAMSLLVGHVGKPLKRHGVWHRTWRLKGSDKMAYLDPDRPILIGTREESYPMYVHCYEDKDTLRAFPRVMTLSTFLARYEAVKKVESWDTV